MPRQRLRSGLSASRVASDWACVVCEVVLPPAFSACSVLQLQGTCCPLVQKLIECR